MPVQIEYYDAAKKKIKSKITVDKDGKMTDGPFERYDENGVLEEKGACKHYNGHLCKVGLYERYSNGELRERRTYTGNGFDECIGPFEEYFDNGQLKEKGTYTGQTEPEFIGPYECYGQYSYWQGPWSPRRYGSHFLRKKCTYAADGSYDGPFEERTDGDITYIEGDEDARIVRCTYKNGELDGSYESHSKGEKIKCTYKDGKLEGEYSKDYFYGLCHCFYKNGELDGEYTLTKNGTVIVKGRYQEGKKVGHWEEYGSTYEYVDGQKHGPYTYFHNGIEERGTYKNGKKDGAFEVVDRENGKERVFCRGSYKDGKLDGPFEKDSNGEKIKCTYKDGEYEGLYEEWEDGKLIIRGMMSGKPEYGQFSVNGEFTSFYENGNIREHYTAIKNKKEGPYECRADDGKILIKCSYKNGELDGPYEEYYPDGTLQKTATYKNGREEGEVKLYNKNGKCCEIAHYKDGELDGLYEEFDDYGCLVQRCTYKDGDAIDEYHHEYFRSGNNHGSLDSQTRSAKIDMSTEDYWGNWSSACKVSEKTYEALAKCKNLEVLSIGWTNVDAKAISHCKHLKTLRIDQTNGYGSSGYPFTGEDLKALGHLPELEKLEINGYGLTDKDFETIHEQFPRLKYLGLNHTSVGREGAEIIDKYVPNFKISGERSDETITTKSLAETRMEEARIKGLIGEGYKEKFKEAVARGDAQEAFEIMLYNGLIGRRNHSSGTRFEREFGLTDTNPGWGKNIMDERDIFHGVRMKDLGNGNVAFATKYESQYWHSTVGQNNSDIEYSYYGDLSVVNVDEGLLAETPVEFNYFLENFDLEVEKDRVFLKGKSLPIAPPTRTDLRSRLRAATDPEQRKGVAQELAKGSYKRNRAAEKIIALRKERDKEKSPLTTRAYQAKKTSTK